MKTDYKSHDREYIARRKKGYQGWDRSEVSERSKAIIRNLLQQIEVPSQSRLLDIGCGAGDLSFALAAEGFRVMGIDVSSVAIGWAEEKAAELSYDVEFKVINAVEKIQLFQQFDLVVDNHCLHCIIGSDRQAYLDNVFHCLIPEGYYLLSSMCGRETGILPFPGYDPDTRYIIRDDIATRYIGTPENITREVMNTGFRIMHSEVLHDEEGEEILLIAQKIDTSDNI
jgi:cyclopropane fatty-acyl-phospholipid synthase-like methyltransferase